jgi:hypothetical protein
MESVDTEDGIIGPPQQDERSADVKQASYLRDLITITGHVTSPMWQHTMSALH